MIRFWCNAEGKTAAEIMWDGMGVDASGKFDNQRRKSYWPIAVWPRNSKRRRLWDIQWGRCHLCDEQMLPEVSDHPDSCTFDHLIPVSKGGTRATNNLKLAHRRCNRMRGDKPL